MNQWTEEGPGRLHLNGVRPAAHPAAYGLHGERADLTRTMAIPLSPAVPLPRTIHVVAGATLRGLERGQVMAVRRRPPLGRRLVRRWESIAAGWALLVVVLLAGAVGGCGLLLVIGLSAGWLRWGL